MLNSIVIRERLVQEVGNLAAPGLVISNSCDSKLSIFGFKIVQKNYCISYSLITGEKYNYSLI